MIYRVILLGGALVAPLPALAQGVPTDPQGYSPYNSRQTIVNQGIPGPIREAPGLALPSIYGLNPCSLGSAVGATTPLFGASLAISSTDHDCQVRNTAALTITALGDKEAGREIMCDIKEFREAELRLGNPCLYDKPPAPVAAVAPPPVAAVTPPSTRAAAVDNSVASKTVAASPSLARTAAATPAVVVHEPVSSRIIPASAPAFCHTPNLDLRLYPECSAS